MSRRLNILFFALLVALTCVGFARAEGEDILGLTGEYTFFIKPCPGSHETYYQKMVPCVERKCEPVPHLVYRTYMVPVPEKRVCPGEISETPVGCAEGTGPCVTCFPRPTCYRAPLEKIAPKMVAVNVPVIVATPRMITRPTMRPQWFKVTENCLPPAPPRKVKPIRK